MIIDLRGNGGGDSSVVNPLFQGLRSRGFLGQSGRLFAFIGNSTFSPPLMSEITLKRELGARALIAERQYHARDMVPASEGAPAHPGDREWVGVGASILLTGALALFGGLLAGGRGTPDGLILVGVVSLLFCGVITSVLVALAASRLARRGWPRAVKGARWASTATALLNVAFWILALLAARKRTGPARAVSASQSRRAGPRLDSGARRPDTIAARDVKLQRE